MTGVGTDKENSVGFSRFDLSYLEELRTRGLPVGKNELLRLSQLMSYQVLDTDPEHDFDRITRLAQLITNCPTVLISFIDDRRQWFKSRIGMSVDSTPRCDSFCQYVVYENKYFEIPNALKDDRFLDNSLVVKDPNIRFYAGAPLTTPAGYTLGSLCAIDYKERNLSLEQREGLLLLAEEVVALLEIRRHRRDFEWVNAMLADHLIPSEIGGDQGVSALETTAAEMILSSTGSISPRTRAALGSLDSLTESLVRFRTQLPGLMSSFSESDWLRFAQAGSQTKVISDLAQADRSGEPLDRVQLADAWFARLIDDSKSASSAVSQVDVFMRSLSLLTSGSYIDRSARVAAHSGVKRMFDKISNQAGRETDISFSPDPEVRTLYVVGNAEEIDLMWLHLLSDLLRQASQSAGTLSVELIWAPVTGMGVVDLATYHALKNGATDMPIYRMISPYDETALALLSFEVRVAVRVADLNNGWVEWAECKQLSGYRVVLPLG